MNDGRVPGEKYLTADELHALEAHGVVKSFPKNTIIVSEGDGTDSLYIIGAGRVKVFVSDEEGREIILATHGAGEYFGEVVLDGGPRSASVMTLEPSRFTVIPKQKFRDLLRSNPEFSVHLVEKLLRRIRALTQNVKSLALMDVYGRVARLLLDLGVEEDGKLVIAGKLTQQEIANRVGASREMISKILKDLSIGGYITVERNRITVNKAPPRHW